MVLQIKNYMVPNAAEGRQRARSDIPFLFKVRPAAVGQANARTAGGQAAAVPPFLLLLLPQLAGVLCPCMHV